MTAAKKTPTTRKRVAKKNGAAKPDAGSAKAAPAVKAARAGKTANAGKAAKAAKAEPEQPSPRLPPQRSRGSRRVAAAAAAAKPPKARDSEKAAASTRAGTGSGAAARRRSKAEGWHGWDDYAAFYDWENARTVGRRDVLFWRDVARRAGGRTLELGCGTGRILVPLARAGVEIVGIDRSAPMLARATTRVRRLRRELGASASGAMLRGDIRQLPFEPATFDLVMAPYGILQSLVRDRDLSETLRAVFAALKPGGVFGLDLVPDVPRWEEYARRVSLRGSRGPRGVPVTLVESVRQDRAKRLTIFDQEFIEGRGRAQQIHRFSLTFRTVSIQSLRGRLERAGFTIDAVLGGYDGRPWDPRADVWVLMASKPRT
jgi:SAM-dependent methyltransferase